MRMFAASALLVALALVLPGTALAHHGVRAGQPFPTNLDTVRDHSQATGLRVDLAKPRLRRASEATARTSTS